MAAPKPYDPIVSIEGMYNGSVTRIAYALQDPANFGHQSKGIIQQCSKQFHEALDDIEIQILDAKWYLEHQLRLRKEQRAIQAQEEQAASAKRKHDQIEADGEKEKDTDAKRQKLEQDAQPQSEPEKPAAASPPKPAPEPAQQPAEPAKPAEPAATEPEKKEDKPATPIKETPVPDKPPETDDLFGSGRPTPTADPGTAGGMDGVDDFNQFESMFGEPTGDDPNMNPEGDLGFDLGMGDDVFGAPTGQNQPSGEASGLESMLPGLESYANQEQNAAGGVTGEDNAQNGADAAMGFDLPELGGPNEFDAFLDANDFGGIDLGNDPNLDGDINNMDAPLDFDSMFS